GRQGRRRSRATRRRRWESRTVDRGSARHQRGLPQLEAQATRRDLQLVERALTQHAVAGTLQRHKDRALVAEPHLALRRVDIDVDLNGVYREVEHGQRKAVRLAQPAVRLFDREREVAMVNATPVDEDHDVLPRTAMQGRRADQAADQRVFDIEHGGRGLRVIDGREGDPQVTVSGRLQDAAPIDVEANRYPRVGHGQFSDEPADHGVLGARLLQEFQTRGCVGEETADRNTRAHRATDTTLGD